MKCNLNDSGLGVLLIMRGPNGFSGGRIHDALVSHLDLFPTLCDLIGSKHPDWLQGNSMMPLIQGNAQSVRDAVFGEINYHAGYEPARCIRTNRWKYIRLFDMTTPRLYNYDDGLSKTRLMKTDWPKRERPAEALYDLILDPNEMNNLSGHPKMQPVLKEMKEALNAWMESTQDPLLSGSIPAPGGAIINAPDSTSPSQKPIPNKV